jgi:hypothetical protein
MSFQDFQQTNNLRPMFLQLYGITLTVKKWLHSTGVNVHEKNPQPLMPFNIGFFLKSRKGSKDMYNVLSRKTVQISAEQKWENILNKYDIEWKNIHFHCTKHAKNTKLCWFQYRIIHRILGTNTFLYKIKVKDCNFCTFCKEKPETIEHLLWRCHKVSDLWHELNRWIFEMTYIEIPLNLEIAMFGLLHPYDANLIKNKIILLTKFYIFRTKVNEGMVNFEALKNYLKENLILEKHISFKNVTPEKYNTYWSHWLPIMER